jgi:protein TonB
MFDIFLPGNETFKKNVCKGLTFSLSLIFHAALITAVIVMPLLRAEPKLPEFKFTDVLIAPPILPGVPPGPGSGRSGRPTAGPADTTKGPKNPPATSAPRGFIAPVDIPTKISEEDPTAGIPGEIGKPGVEGGLGDGKSPWILGQKILTDEINTDAEKKIVARPPRLIKRVSPEYPQLPLLARRSGQVVIEASTDIYGRVREARIITGDILFDEAALKAVRQWIYEPYYINGITIPVKFTVTITFTLETR